MRFKCFLLLAGLGLVFGPAAGLAPPRLQSAEAAERAAPANKPTTLEERWSQLSGGAAVWRRADVTDPLRQFVFDLVADRVQSTNGEITRDQFLGMSQRPGARRPDGAAQAAQAGSESPKPAERRTPTPAAPPSARQANGQGERVGGAEAEFCRRDANGDGLLDQDEMDDGLRAERDRWDTNQDGFIDLDEFRAYFQARSRLERAASRGGPVVVVGGRKDKPTRTASADDLPPGLPDWFRQYDTDGDGQIGLYEWKAAGQPIAQFKAMDNNGDGFLTPDEVLATLPVKDEPQLAREPKEPKEAPRNEHQESPGNADRLLRRVMMEQQVIQLGGKNGGLMIIRSAK